MISASAAVNWDGEHKPTMPLQEHDPGQPTARCSLGNVNVNVIINVCHYYVCTSVSQVQPRPVRPITALAAMPASFIGEVMSVSVAAASMALWPACSMPVKQLTFLHIHHRPGTQQQSTVSNRQDKCTAPAQLAVGQCTLHTALLKLCHGRGRPLHTCQSGCSAGQQGPSPLPAGSAPQRTPHGRLGPPRTRRCCRKRSSGAAWRARRGYRGRCAATPPCRGCCRGWACWRPAPRGCAAPPWRRRR